MCERISEARPHIQKKKSLKLLNKEYHNTHKTISIFMNIKKKNVNN